MTDRAIEPNDRPTEKPANAAPDAVKDPNEKTEGRPGAGQKGHTAEETDPGSG